MVKTNGYIRSRAEQVTSNGDRPATSDGNNIGHFSAQIYIIKCENKKIGHNNKRALSK